MSYVCSWNVCTPNKLDIRLATSESVHADLLAKSDTDTNDIHKPPHSRESNQWKNNLLEKKLSCLANKQTAIMELFTSLV